MSPPAAAVARERRRRGLLLVAGVAAIAVLAVAIAAGGDTDPPAPRAPAARFTVGSGARGAVVWRARGGRRRPPVVFLHGWGMTGPRAYHEWLSHLAARGSDVIVPRYQSSLRTSSAAVPDNALAGVRRALARLPRPREVVVAGHSVGAVLAVDYAVRAGQAGLPPARAVMAVYPGAVLRRMPPVPAEDPAGIPATTRRLLVFESTADNVVGTTPAEAIHQGAVQLPADRRELVAVDDPAAADHFAPVLDSPAARRVFWRRLDGLLAGGG